MGKFLKIESFGTNEDPIWVHGRLGMKLDEKIYPLKNLGKTLQKRQKVKKIEKNGKKNGENFFCFVIALKL